MSIPVRSRRVLLVVLLLVVACGAGAAAWSQARPEDSTLAAVTAELRQLRLTVDESMRLQAQTQALGALLETRQSRIVHLTTRLDLVRRELADAIVKAREWARAVASDQSTLAREQDPQRRLQLDQALRGDREEANQAAGIEQALRTRETELLDDIQTEESRLTDSVARLDQLVKR